jgi:DNA-binding transcriptional ArsR family regulator
MGRKEKQEPTGQNEEGVDAQMDLGRVLHALSDPVRLGIVSQLYREGEASCGALDAGRPKSTMSHHFRVLREAGLVHTRIEGLTHVNSLRLESVQAAFPGLLEAIMAAASRQS